MEEQTATAEGGPCPPTGEGWIAWLALNASTGALLAAILLVGMATELWAPLMPEYLSGLEAPVLLIALYGSTKDLLEAVNFYLWDSDEAAKKFFSDQLLEGVTALYGVRPTIEYADVR